MSKPKRYSELQLKALDFYRKYLIFARTKDEPLRSNLEHNARTIMETHRDIPRRKYNYIEFILRTEINKLEMLRTANISSVQRISGKK